jgi:hypothetical protein
MKEELIFLPPTIIFIIQKFTSAYTIIIIKKFVEIEDDFLKEEIIIELPIYTNKQKQNKTNSERIQKERKNK